MSESWETLKVVGTEEDAELVAGFLRSEGIACTVESVHSHEFPVPVNKLGEVRLYVHPEDLERAQRLIESRAPSADEAGDDG
jgi:formate dehydrogenase assembly factor FdhD